MAIFIDREKIDCGTDLVVDEIKGGGVPLLLPRYTLHGIQRPEEYSRSKLEGYRGIVEDKGLRFFWDNPVQACAIPVRDGLVMALLDGHHRTRLAGLYKVSHIPSEVFTTDQVANCISRRKGIRVNPEDLRTAILRCVADAIASFDRLPPHKHPSTLWGVESVTEIARRFPSFSTPSYLC
jgi:hypothetical protein